MRIPKRAISIAAVVGATALAGVAPASTVPNLGADRTDVKVGNLPRGMAVTTDGKFLFVATTDVGIVKVDIAKQQVVESRNRGNYPNGVAVAPGTQVVYPGNGGGSSITRIDFSKPDDDRPNPFDTSVLGGGPLHFAIAMSPDGETLYVANGGACAMAVLDAEPNALRLNTVYEDVLCQPTDLVLDRAGKIAYLTNGDAVKSYDATNEFAEVATLPTRGNPQSTALVTFPSGSFAYIADGDGSVSVVNIEDNSVTDTVSVGSNPLAIVASPDGTRVFVANGGDDTVSVIQTTDNVLIDTFKTGGDPNYLAISDDGSTLFVANRSDGTVSIIPLSNTED